MLNVKMLIGFMTANVKTNHMTVSCNVNQ